MDQFTIKPPHQTVIQRQETVSDFARKLSLQDRIERAFSFSPNLQRAYSIPVSWNSRLRNSAGQAGLRQGSFFIELHPGLDVAKPAELEATFLHELAHIMAYLEYGLSEGRGHSKEWWEQMIRLGEKPWKTRFHNISSCKKSFKGLTSAPDVSLEELGL